MTGYLFRRIGGALLVLFGLTTILYALFYLAPSDPAVLTCGKGCTPERLADVRHAMGVDDPVHVQYGHFLEGLAAGRDYPSGPDVRHCPAPCLGYSFETDQPVTALLTDRLPVSVSLAIGAEALSLIVGIGAGMLSGLRRHRWLDRLVNGLVLTGYAVPVFLVGLLLLLLFCVVLQWLPFPAYVPLTTSPLLWAQNLLLPWVALATIQAAAYARLTRSGIQETRNIGMLQTGKNFALLLKTSAKRRGIHLALEQFERHFLLKFSVGAGCQINRPHSACTKFTNDFENADILPDENI